MKQKKFLSILIAACLAFTLFFTETSQALEQSSSVPTSTATSGDYIYYTMYQENDVIGYIYKVNINTKKNILVKKIKWASISNLTVKNGWIYCSYSDAGGRNYIYRVRTNGKDAKVLKKGYSPVVYNNSIYYIKQLFDDLSDNYDPVAPVGIYKMSLSGKNDTCVKTTSTVSDITVYNSNIYYITNNENTKKSYLNRTSLSGKSSKTLASGSILAINHLNTYSGYVYFNLGRNVYRIKSSSNTKSKFLSNADILDFSNGNIYYTVNKNYNDYLYKMNLSSKRSKFIMKKFSIVYVSALKNYILVDYSINSNDYYNSFVYLYTTDGKVVKKLNSYCVV